MDSVFDQYGKVRRDLDEHEIATMPVVKRNALMTMIDAAIKSEDADQASVEAESATRAAARNVASKLDAHRKLTPARSFHDEWRETVAKFPPVPVDPATTGSAAAAALDVELANAVLETCRAAAFLTQRTRNDCRQVFATAAAAWSLVDGSPKTTAELVRENVKRETEHKLAILSGKVTPDVVEPVRRLSQLDSVLSSGARGSSANFGYRRPLRPVQPR
jgi:hypothetical protein